MNKLINIRRLRGAALLSAVAVASAARAAAPDYSTLTAAVDFSTVATAVLGIAALIAVALVVKRGAKMVLGMIGR